MSRTGGCAYQQKVTAANMLRAIDIFVECENILRTDDTYAITGSLLCGQSARVTQKRFVDCGAFHTLDGHVARLSMQSIFNQSRTDRR